MLTEKGRKYKEELEARIAKRIADFKVEQRELILELARVGVKVDIVNRLPSISTTEYRHAIPILMEHLRRDYSDGTLESLARALATKDASEYWEEIVAMYQSSPARTDNAGSGFAMGLAAAVAGACPPKRIPDLIVLLRDRRLPYRALLLAPLRKRRGKSSDIAHVIEELRHDPDLATEINSWKILPSQPSRASH